MLPDARKKIELFQYAWTVRKFVFAYVKYLIVDNILRNKKTRHFHINEQ